MSKATAKDTVRVHYTGKLEDGQVFDSSVQRDPIEVTLGQGMLIPGFEKGIVGMEESEKKTINIPKEEAYGDVNKELFHKVPNDNLPEEIKPEVGMGLMAKNPDGSERQLRVAEVNDDHIIVDANHPLAGKDLTFDLELVEIK
ncbi:FKBP-type peptidyl-prolyl cis-trans isomerase [Luteirhabdus pelagi]|uniref:FKBP-type peptidyl-prolyl cis-trans isomerase n=1 Tax=Luteirhabdus pelagi TaxID=2792783 RepID=UPI00193ACB26|nr:peptidylprolyl isomerase [Luteirhabdus pelagi]MCT8341136.1 peptidylprolyl isomerase [Thermobacterium salinum]